MSQNLPWPPAASAASAGLQGVRMHFFLREMAEDQRSLPEKCFSISFTAGAALLANGTLEIAVLDERTGACIAPERVIDSLTVPDSSNL